MTDLEKIIIATGTINLLATQLHFVTVIKKVTVGDETASGVSSDEKALEECLENLRHTMEELGNYIDNGESFNEETLRLVNESFYMVHDRGSFLETTDEEISRLKHALELIAGYEDESKGALDEVQTIAHDAINFKAGDGSDMRAPH